LSCEPGLTGRRWRPPQRSQHILDGTYLPGEQLPTEQAFIQETGWSRDTVRAAVKLLRDSGWATVTHGLGTFVNPLELQQS
jgi:GntR family transcriptional repressor for pyruvate dehydrogenase complex